MQLNYFIEGLQILRPHYNNVNGYHIGAEHDQFYAYATDTPLSENEFKRMRELNWFQPDVNEDKEDIYDSQEGWSAYT